MKKILFLVVFLGNLMLATGQTISRGQIISFTATMSGANEMPPNHSPLTGIAYLQLEITHAGSGVTNLLLGSVAFLSYPGFPEFFGFESGTVTFQHENGSTITNLTLLGPPFSGFSPGPILLPGVILVEYAPPIALTSEQVRDVLAGRWFIHANPTISAGEVSFQNPIRGRIVLLDSDGDGVPDHLDACPGTPAGAAVDAHGCSIEQLCPCRDDGKNHGDYVMCVGKTAAGFQREGLITAAAERAIVQTAANSDCGRKLTPAAPFSGITGRSFLIPYPLPGVPSCDGCPGFDWSFPTSIKVFSDSGGLISEFATDAHGQFEIHLKQGKYLLVPWTPPPPAPVRDPFLGNLVLTRFPCAAPFEVTVPFKQPTNVVIHYGQCFGQ